MGNIIIIINISLVKNPEKKISTTSIYILDLNTGESKALTYLEGKADSNPVWTPNENTILFLSTRGNGIWSVDMSGKVQQVVSYPGNLLQQ
jgi:Tol biopolymer transport system component